MAFKNTTDFYLNIICDTTEINKQFDEIIEKVSYLKKLSFWFVIKMRLLGIHKRRTMISIQDLIEKDHQYKL
jgi:hypothetical protein